MWREPLAESSRVLARTFDPERGWQETEVVADGLDAPYLGCIDMDAHYFDVSIDAEGMAIWSSQLLAGAGWQPPLRVDADEGNAMLPIVAVDPNSTAIALYSAQSADGTATLATNRLAPPDALPTPTWICDEGSRGRRAHMARVGVRSLQRGHDDGEAPGAGFAGTVRCGLWIRRGR